MKIMDIDEAVYDVCRDWYDGAETPLMYAVAYRSTGDKSLDIEPRALLAEIESCPSGCVAETEARKLDRACDIIRQRIDRDEVLLQIVMLVDRAKKAGLDQDEFVIMAASAWEFEG